MLPEQSALFVCVGLTVSFLKLLKHTTRFINSRRHDFKCAYFHQTAPILPNKVMRFCGVVVKSGERSVVNIIALPGPSPKPIIQLIHFTTQFCFSTQYQQRKLKFFFVQKFFFLFPSQTRVHYCAEYKHQVPR